MQKIWCIIKTDKFAVCSSFETIEHCFLQCSRATRVRYYFAHYLCQFIDASFSVTECCIFYPLSDLPSSARSSLFCYLISTILYWVWHARNQATLRSSLFSSEQIIRLTTNDIRLRIRLATIEKVRSFWSHNDVLCSVDDNNKVTFSL